MTLTEIATAITHMGDPELWRYSDTEIGDLVPALNAAIHTLEATRIDVIREFTARGKATGDDGHTITDTPSWIAMTSNLSYDDARRLDRLTTALARHPDIEAAYRRGDINTTDARLITTFLDRPPVTIPDAALPACHEFLLLAAHGGNTRLLRRSIIELAARFPDKNGTPPAEDTTRNEFYASTVAGRVLVKGDLDTETGNMLLAALSPLTGHHDSADGPDHRSPAQRRAAAFAEILRRYLDSGTSPAEGGDRPHLHLHIAARDLADPTTCTHTHPTLFDTDTDNSAADNDDTSAEAGPGDAPVATGPAAEDPVDWAAVLRSAHTGWLSWTGPISPAAARRIACDCHVTPIVLDDNDAPLNLGRTNRVVSRRLRRAVLARDHGCAFPQCGRPAEWCEVHHVRPWIDGGATDLDNLVMICREHHRLLHHSDWQVTIGTDRHPWFTPPQHHDPLRTPLPANGRASPRTA